MEIVIHRYRIREVTCDGTLSIDGVKVCDTAENTGYRPPVGTYWVELKYHAAMGRKVPVLIPTGRTGRLFITPYLAIGNGVYNRRDARIILGEYIVPGCLKCSREPFMLLYNRINNSLRRGHVVTVRIEG